MSKNIEINIATSSNTYEILYPKTDYNILLNKPTIPTVPSLPLSISNGGTGVTSYSSLANQLSSYFAKNAKIGSYQGTNVSGQTITINFETGAKFLLIHNIGRAIYNSTDGVSNVALGLIWFVLTKTGTDSVRYPTISGYINSSGQSQVNPRYIGIVRLDYEVYSTRVEITTHRVYLADADSTSTTKSDSYILNRNETYYYSIIY